MDHHLASIFEKQRDHHFGALGEKLKSLFHDKREFAQQGLELDPELEPKWLEPKLKIKTL